MAEPERLRIAYLTNEYPKVSHTFIRRELRQMEAFGHEVLRFAVRDNARSTLVDEADFEELEKTVYALKQGYPKLFAQLLRVATERPVKFLKALKMTLGMERVSERGLIRHAAYLVEAAFFLKEFERFGIDHVHVHFGTNPAAVARLVRCLGGPSYSVTIHGPAEFDAPIGLSLGAKSKEAAFVAAISSYCAAQVRRWVDFDQWEKIHVVHCPVDEKFFEAARPIPEGSKQIVCVGRLAAHKGHVFLLEAFAKLKASGVEARLVLAGDGELREELERRINRLSLLNDVVITGWVNESQVRELLLASRGLVLASFSEGLPVVLMEALALARPVVTTNVAGIPELVENGKTGFVVPPANEEALVGAMREILTLPIERLNDMGRRGQEAVRAQHSVKTEAKKLEQLIKNHFANRKA